MPRRHSGGGNGGKASPVATPDASAKKARTPTPRNSIGGRLMPPRVNRPKGTKQQSKGAKGGSKGGKPKQGKKPT